MSGARVASVLLALGAVLLLGLALAIWRETAAVAPAAEPDGAAGATALALAHAELMSAAASDPTALVPRWEAFGQAVVRAATPPLREVLFRLPPYAPAMEAARSLLAGTEIAAEGAEAEAFAAAVQRLGGPVGGLLGDLLRAADESARERDAIAARRLHRLELLAMGMTLLVLAMIAAVCATLWHRARDAADTLAAEIARRDAVDQARAAEQMAARDKAALLAAANDDLRSPLNRVVGLLSEALVKLAPEDAEHAALADARGIAHGAMTLVGDLADLARLEAGHRDDDGEAFRPADVAQRVAHLMQPRAEERRTQIELQAAGDLPDWWWGNATRMRQILFAILGAALRETEGVRMTLRLGAAPRGGLRAAVIASTTPGTVGTESPSLALASEMARMQQGTLAVRRDGSGWTAVLDLPLRPTEAPAASPVAGRGTAVLIADAGLARRRVLAALLDRHGYHVTIEDRGVAALLHARAAAFRAVFVAVDLPDLAAAAFARALQAAPGASTGAAIILLADATTAQIRAPVLPAEFSAMLTTPLSEQAVLASLSASADGGAWTAVPLLDTETGQLLAGSLSAGDARALINATLAEAEEHAAALREALARGDRSALVAQARALAIVADVIGAQRLRAQADHIAADPGQAGGTLEQVAMTLARTKDVLQPGQLRGAALLPSA